MTDPRPADPVTAARDALLAKLTSDWDFDPYGEHEAAVMRLRDDLDNLIALVRASAAVAEAWLARAEAGVSVEALVREEHRPVPYRWSQSGESGTVCAASLTGLHSRVTPWPCSVESAIIAAHDRLAARSAGSGSRVEAHPRPHVQVAGDGGICAGCGKAWPCPEARPTPPPARSRVEGWADNDAYARAFADLARRTPPPAGATQVLEPATDSTPPPAVDGTREGLCVYNGCGETSDYWRHARTTAQREPSLHHPFTPPAPTPDADRLRAVEALVASVDRDIAGCRNCANGQMWVAWGPDRGWCAVHEASGSALAAARALLADGPDGAGMEVEG